MVLLTTRDNQGKEWGYHGDGGGCQVLMRDFETRLESVDDGLGVWNLEEIVEIE